MPGIAHPLLFCGTVALIAVTPGPDTLYIVGRTLSQGRRGGLFSVAGIALGCLTHTLAAAAGLSALLYASAPAFTAVKLLGAAYLVYLGIRLLRARAGKGTFSDGVRALPAMPPGTILLQGYVTNVLNPKVALFFLAFLPQFLDPAAPRRFAGLLELGLLFTLIGNLWSLVLVGAALPFVRMLRRFPGIEPWIDRATGALFVGLGLRLALFPR
ncbi:MAG TPA: LysE family translocator [Candidatus Methylacidiphilales bacterium]